MFPFTHDPSTLVVGELFKVIDGKIMMIQAVMANMPANAWNLIRPAAELPIFDAVALRLPRRGRTG